MDIIKEVPIKIIDKHVPLIEGAKGHNFLSGGRGGAKSHSIASIVIFRTFDYNRNVLCTREIQKSIDQSVYSLLKTKIREAKIDGYFNIAKTYIENKKTGNDFVFAGLREHTVDSIKSYENRSICWIEEAQSVSSRSFDILIPTIIRNPNYEIYYSYNKFTEQDPVDKLKDSIDPVKKNDIYTNIYDNALINPDMLEEAEDMKKKDYNKWLHIYMGEPISQTDKAILNRVDIQYACERVIENPEGAFEIGVDVARYGADRTTIFKRKGFKVVDYQIHTKLSNVEVANHVEVVADRDKDMIIKIDTVGVGSGVADVLRDRGYKNIVDVNFGAKAKNPDKYPNLISEAWFEFGEIINEIEIPSDDELKNELATREWKPDNKGRRQIESKEEYKKRGFRSPDKADGLLICFYKVADNKPYYAFV